MSRQRVLDPSLAQFAGRTARPSGRSTRGRPRTRPERLSRSSFKKREAQTPLEKLKAELQVVDNAILLLKDSKDPFTFASKQKEIKETIESRKKNFALPENQAELSSELVTLQEDESTVSRRLTQLQGERSDVNTEIQTQKELIQRVTGQLKQAKIQLRDLQTRFDSLGSFVADSKREQERILQTLKQKQSQLAQMEEETSRRTDALKLISETENKLSEAATDFGAVEKSFLLEWQNWTVQQMISWMCQQDPAYEQYRGNLTELLPKQAESGADFVYFDTNILLGLGISKIRHRGELMKSIAQLVN